MGQGPVTSITGLDTTRDQSLDLVKLMQNIANI